MNSNAIQYSTTKQQIQKLRAQGLSFDDVSFAEYMLGQHGYYNIINSYKEPYMVVDAYGIRTYKPGTTFEQIFSLYMFDHRIRNSIMGAMLDFEEHLKTELADVIASSFGTDHNVYLQKKNYANIRVHNKKFSLDETLKKLNKDAGSDKNPIAYFRNNYGIIPPWILFKGSYFGTIINFVRFLKPAQKSVLIQKLYNVPPKQSLEVFMRNLLQETLFLCSDYRNTAAHGGRIYNFASIHYQNIINNADIISNMPIVSSLPKAESISSFLLVLDLMNYDGPLNILNPTVHSEINRHLNQYPQDIAVLESLIGSKINAEQYVWISPKTGIAHDNEHCSGMTNGIRINASAWNPNINKPCKKCIKVIQ